MDFKQRRDVVLANLENLPKYEVPWMRIPSEKNPQNGTSWQSLEVRPQVSYL